MNSVGFLKLTILIIVSLIRSAYGEIFAECENLEDGTFIIGTQGCKSYIYCEGEESYEGFCPSQLLFNTIDGSCAPEDEVDCTDGDVATTEAETAPPITKPTTTTQTTTMEIVEPAIETTSQTEVEIPEVESTKSPESIVTTVNTTPGSITTNTGGGVIVVSTPTPDQICPISDDPQAVVLLPSENSCSEYFICYHGTPVRMICSGQLLFDYVTLKCELPIRANCKASIQTTMSPKTKCVHNTYDFYPYPKNCNYFYTCMNGFLSLQQCPEGFGWSEEMKLCLKLDYGRCPIRAIDKLQNQSWLNI